MMPTTITNVDARPIDLALTEPFAIAGGAPAVARNVLVKVTLDDGTVGLGEAAPFTEVSGETQRGTLDAVLSTRPSLVGQDARRYRQISDQLSDALPKEPSARCALEMAILDAFTRHLCVPLWVFFGGQGSALETDMTITAGDAAHAARAATSILARGIQTSKVKVGALSPAEDIDRLVAVHRAAPASKLVVDANGGYTPEEASVFLDEVRKQRLPVELFEQPVDRESWLEFSRIRPDSPVLVCADESARTAVEVLDLIARRAVDAVNIKPMKSGIVESLAIWQVARTAGIELMIGGMLESVLAMSFSTHLAAGLGGFRYVDLDMPMFMTDHPFSGGFEQTGGRLSVAHVTAGHGVELAKRWPDQ